MYYVKFFKKKKHVVYSAVIKVMYKYLERYLSEYIQLIHVYMKRKDLKSGVDK